MKRIDIAEMREFIDSNSAVLYVAQGINEIMDYLEHMTRKNGKLFTCVNCNHATGFIGDLGKCCDNPLYEVSE